MNISQETIRKIAEFKFPGDRKRAEAYVKSFNPSDPACIDDEKAFFAESKDVDLKLGEMRQRFRVEDYFIRKLIYDFYTGEVHAYLFVGSDADAKRKADALMKGDPQERKMAEWIRGGFTDKPLTLGQEKPLLYEEAMQKFSDKYGIHLDAQNVASAIQEIANDKEGREDAYRQYFKCLFASAYCRIDQEKQAHIDVFCKDFNRVMMTILQEKTGVGSVPAMKGKPYAYGGMSMEEIKDYLLSFRETANDLTKQAQDAQKEEKDPFSGAEEKIRNIFKDRDDDENKLSRGMAELQALEITHGTRPKYYWLTSPIKNYREKKTIKNIKKMMISFTSDEKKVEEMERRKTIYRPSFFKEREKISTFAENTVKEFDLDTVLTSENLDLDADFIMELPDERESMQIEPVFSDDRCLGDMAAPVPISANTVSDDTPQDVPTVVQISQNDSFGA